MRPSARAAALAAALLPLPVAAQTLTMGIGASVTSADPHFFNASPNFSYALHVFDSLVERDARAALIPGLAESWKATSDTTWEFKLRQGVTWHDGRPFTAADVLFTLERAPNVPNSPGGFQGFVRAIKSAEAIDPHTVRITTHAPHPLLPGDLASIIIVSEHAGRGAATEDYNSGKAAIGTGPFKQTLYRQGDRAELERNDAYWGNKPHWKTVVQKQILNDASRTAALLSGDVDLIDYVPSADLARLKREAKVKVSDITGLRVIYLMPDFSRTGDVPNVSDKAGNPLGKNPFLDRRVREALTISINRDALVDRVMEGTATPNGQWLPPGLSSYAPDVPVPKFDAERARRLLAEAGYPDGFRFTFSTPNNRYPNDEKTAQAVAQMWTRIGLDVKLEAQPWAVYSARAAKQDYAVRLAGWGSVTGEASYTLVNVLGTYDLQKRTGSSNSSRYSNPALDALTTEAVATLDDEKRDGMLRQAVKLAMDDIAMIPVFQLVNFWAHRADLTYDARMDERTIAEAVRPAR